MRSEEGSDRVIWRGHPAWSEYVFLWFFSMIFAVRAGLAFWMGQEESTRVFGLGAVFFLGTAVFLRYRSSYRLTRRNVYKYQGILGRSDRIIPIRDIREVKIRRGSLDRFLGIGVIVLKRELEDEERLIGVKNPEVVYRKIKALL